MKKSRKQLISSVCLVLFLALGVVTALHYRTQLWAIITDQAARDGFINWVQSKGALGVLVFLGLQVLQVVVAVLPGEPIELMAGAIYGTWGGLALCMLGILIGSMLIYSLVKLLGAKALPAEALTKYRFLQDEARARSALYLLFFLPGTPKDMLTYIGPFLPLPANQFFAICTIARIPSILTSTLAGDQLAEGTVWLPVVIFIITGVAGLAAILNEERILTWMRNKKQAMQTRK